MHSYAIDTGERKTILLLLAGASIILTWGFHQLLGNSKIVLPWWVESPSVLFFYGLLYIFFDKWIWEYFRRVGIIKTPNLNGKWNGYLKTSFDDHTSKIKATLKIFQTWTKIKVILTTEQSSSYSEVASLVIETPEGKYLSYQYLNEPKSNALQTMSIHRGTVRVLFDEKKNALSGEYYSGRGRQNFGSLYFKRETKD